MPGAISVVTGDEIRARGATDLRTALALLGGVSVAPGGDAGPASAVPGLLGVREVDDLLLLIDGIPAGGAFMPQVEAISLNNVERIEVLRGAAPVYFGTTAFAGTINVIHYAAGSAERVDQRPLRQLQSGGHGRRGGPVRRARAPIDQRRGERRQDLRRARRVRPGPGQLAAGHRAGRAAHSGPMSTCWRCARSPTSRLPIDEATGQFTTLLPVDFNQNPANAKLDTDRYKVVLGYDLPLSFGRWGNYGRLHPHQHRQRARLHRCRRILRSRGPPKTNADLESFQQSLQLQRAVHRQQSHHPADDGLDLTTGVNLLLGRANADSLRYGLRLLLDGVSQAPNIESVDPKGTVDFIDRRRFVGLYAQSRYQLTPSASLLAGLRWNTTHETRDETRVNSRGRGDGRTGRPGRRSPHRLAGRGVEGLAGRGRPDQRVDAARQRRATPSSRRKSISAPNPEASPRAAACSSPRPSAA